MRQVRRLVTFLRSVVDRRHPSPVESPPAEKREARAVLDEQRRRLAIIDERIAAQRGDGR